MPDHIRAVLEAAADGQVFFPGTAFPVDTWHEFKGAYAAGALALLEEAPLPEYVGGETIAVYRFVWLRTFDPAVVVRISELPDARGRVSAKMSSEDAGLGIGSVAGRKERTVNRRRMARLRRLISQGGFWGMLPTSEDHGLDGADWLLEVALAARYHVVCRWSPGSGLVRTLGQEMIRLSGFSIKSRNTY